MFETGFVFPEKVTGSNCLLSAAGHNAVCTIDSGSLVPLQCIKTYSCAYVDVDRLSSKNEFVPVYLPMK